MPGRRARESAAKLHAALLDRNLPRRAGRIWGSPTRGDRWLTFEDYVDVYLADCVDHLCRAHGTPAVDVLGICEGGVFSLCYAALYPERVKNLVLTIAPVDFHQDQTDGKPGFGLLNLWTRGLSADDIDRLVEANGNLTGELMSHVFAQMTPAATMSKYNVGLLDTFDDEKKLLNFLRMEKWLADRPHHPGEAAKQLLINLYKDNELIRGVFELGGRKVRLSDVRAPVLNVYAKEDHIIPPATTQALRGAVGSTDYSRARPRRRSPGRVRQRQVARRARPGHRGLVARARLRTRLRCRARAPKSVPVICRDRCGAPQRTHVGSVPLHSSVADTCWR